jgi:hypothetical protein
MERLLPLTRADATFPCPCGGTYRRKASRVRHWWPSNYRPGNEESAQRDFLDPDRLAHNRDEFHRLKAAHVERNLAEEKAAREAAERAETERPALEYEARRITA